MPHDLDDMADDFERHMPVDQSDLREGEKEAALDKVLEDEKAVRAAVRQVAASELGMVVMRRIYAMTGYSSFLAQRSATGFDTTATMYNVARRDLWVELRGMLDAKELREIENPILGDI